MPVYVDDMYLYPLGRYGRMKMSHMVADTQEELLQMADKLGLARRWLQHPGSGRSREHFDISMAKRAEAVKAGAIEMPMQDLVRMLQRWRVEDQGKDHLDGGQGHE